MKVDADGWWIEMLFPLNLFWLVPVHSCHWEYSFWALLEFWVEGQELRRNREKLVRDGRLDQPSNLSQSLLSMLASVNTRGRNIYPINNSSSSKLNKLSRSSQKPKPEDRNARCIERNSKDFLNIQSLLTLMRLHNQLESQWFPFHTRNAQNVLNWCVNKFDSGWSSNNDCEKTFSATLLSMQPKALVFFLFKRTNNYAPTPFSFSSSFCSPACVQTLFIALLELEL